MLFDHFLINRNKKLKRLKHFFISVYFFPIEFSKYYSKFFSLVKITKYNIEIKKFISVCFHFFYFVSYLFRVVIGIIHKPLFKTTIKVHQQDKIRDNLEYIFYIEIYIKYINWINSIKIYKSFLM